MVEQLEPLVPIGTEIVTCVPVTDHSAGSVGIITASPVDSTRSYQIRLVNCAEISLGRDEFTIMKHFQQHGIDGPGAGPADYDLHDCVIYRCVAGSRAYEKTTLPDRPNYGQANAFLIKARKRKVI